MSSKTKRPKSYKKCTRLFDKKAFGHIDENFLCNNATRRYKSITKKDKTVEYYLPYFSRNLHG